MLLLRTNLTVAALLIPRAARQKRKRPPFHSVRHQTPDSLSRRLSGESLAVARVNSLLRHAFQFPPCIRRIVPRAAPRARPSGSRHDSTGMPSRKHLHRTVHRSCPTPRPARSPVPRARIARWLQVSARGTSAIPTSKCRPAHPGLRYGLCPAGYRASLAQSTVYPRRLKGQTSQKSQSCEMAPAKIPPASRRFFLADPETTIDRRTLFSPQSQSADKNLPNLCSTLASRAGNCPRARHPATRTTLPGRRETAAAQTTALANPIQPARRPPTAPPVPRRSRSRFARIFSSVWRPNRALAINIIFSAFGSRTRSPNTAKSTDSIRASNPL